MVMQRNRFQSSMVVLSIMVVVVMLLVVGLVVDHVSAFSAGPPPPLVQRIYRHPTIRPSSTTSSSSLSAVVDPTSFLSTTTNGFWISTIDSDIASIPTNEFATVFAGGIAVMIGGLISTVILGTIIDKGNLYADLAAESYIQAGDDPEFWKNLSEEETKKAKEMLAKIKESKEGGVPMAASSGDVVEDELASSVLGALEEDANDDKPKTVATKASSDMFSDYD